MTRIAMITVYGRNEELLAYEDSAGVWTGISEPYSGDQWDTSVRTIRDCLVLDPEKLTEFGDLIKRAITDGYPVPVAVRGVVKKLASPKIPAPEPSRLADRIRSEGGGHPMSWAKVGSYWVSQEGTVRTWIELRRGYGPLLLNSNQYSDAEGNRVVY